MLEPVDKEADSDWPVRFREPDKRNRTVSGSRKRTCDTHTDAGCLTKLCRFLDSRLTNRARWRVTADTNCRTT